MNDCVISAEACSNVRTHFNRLEWNVSEKRGLTLVQKHTDTNIHAAFIVICVNLWCSVCNMWNGVYWITIKETCRRTVSAYGSCKRINLSQMYIPCMCIYNVQCTLGMCKIMWVWNELNKSHKLHSIWVVHVTQWAFKIATIHPDTLFHSNFCVVSFILPRFGSCNAIGLSHQTSFQTVEWQYLLGAYKKCTKILSKANDSLLSPILGYKTLHTQYRMYTKAQPSK